jgi:hypothetical protein
MIAPSVRAWSRRSYTTLPRTRRGGTLLVRPATRSPSKTSKSVSTTNRTGQRSRRCEAQAARAAIVGRNVLILPSFSSVRPAARCGFYLAYRGRAPDLPPILREPSISCDRCQHRSPPRFWGKLVIADLRHAVAALPNVASPTRASAMAMREIGRRNDASKLAEPLPSCRKQRAQAVSAADVMSLFAYPAL